jgi:hypothetical protein
MQSVCSVLLGKSHRLRMQSFGICSHQMHRYARRVRLTDACIDKSSRRDKEIRLETAPSITHSAGTFQRVGLSGPTAYS